MSLVTRPQWNFSISTELNCFWKVSFKSSLKFMWKIEFEIMVLACIYSFDGAMACFVVVNSFLINFFN